MKERYIENRKDRIVLKISYLIYVLTPIAILALLGVFMGSSEVNFLVVCILILMGMIYSGIICHSVYIRNLYKKIEEISKKEEANNNEGPIDDNEI